MLRIARGISFALSLALATQAIAQDMRPTVGTSNRLGNAPPATTTPSPIVTPHALVQGQTLDVDPHKAHPDHKTMAEYAVVAFLMAASVFGYKGNCACPHYRDARGSACGGRSAYVKPNGAKPLCYPTDVTPQMLNAFRATGVPAAALALNAHP